MWMLATRLAQYSVEPLILGKGAVVLEILNPGQALVISPLFGDARVKREDRKTFDQTASPGRPVFLWVPGRYSVRAVTRLWGVRGERCRMM